MTVKGDFARLRQLQAGIRNASRSAQRDVLKVFSIDLDRETQRCFQTSRSPYGEAWEPLKNPPARRRGGKILMDTRRLANSIRFRPFKDFIRGGSNVVYAAVHNYGGTINHAARTELRRYSVGKNDQRARIGLFSKRQRSVTKGVSIGAHEGVIPRRQFLPDQARGLPARYETLLRKTSREVLKTYGLGGR